MAMPRLPLLTPHLGPRRRAAAAALTLAVLAAHLAALRATPPPLPKPAPMPAPPQLRMQVQIQSQVQSQIQLQAQSQVQSHTRTQTPTPTPIPPRPQPALAAPAPDRVSDPQQPAAQRKAPVSMARAQAAPRPAVWAPGAEREPLASAPGAEPESDATAPWPVYAAVLPPTGIRHYRLQRGDRSSLARLTWAHDAQGYSLELMAEGGDLDGLGAASRGQVGPAGLVPERHVERRRGRDQRATNFDLTSGQARGSGGGEPHPWPAGGQDRLSWLLQLAAVLRADPALSEPGARVVLPVAGPRGPSSAWVFTVRGREDLALADGRTLSGLALHRAAQHPYDLQVDVWLDPGDHHLPLRLKLAAPPGRWESIWLSQASP